MVVDVAAHVGQNDARKRHSHAFRVMMMTMMPTTISFDESRRHMERA
jgi:hypothetical protein